MPQLHLTTEDIYAARIHGHTAPVAVLDLTQTYQHARHPSPGNPVVQLDHAGNGKVLIAVFRLWQSPFTHPGAYLAEHANELAAVTLDDALHGRTGSTNPLLAVTLVDRDDITCPWDERSTAPHYLTESR